MKNKNLNNAKIKKDDEYYTQLKDVIKEVNNYTEQLKNKIVYCNCDSFDSNFFKYFLTQFYSLGLKKLICTYYNKNGVGGIFEYNKGETLKFNEVKFKSLEGDGDFNSPECIKILKTADVVITNPPFSLLRDFINCLIKYNKKFLIVSNLNVLTNKFIFSLIKEQRVSIGFNKVRDFILPDKSVASLGNGIWLTDLPNNKYNDFIELSKKYEPNLYPKYDNLDAINVDKTKNIPCDYFGLMGVPISFLEKHNPKQFDIIGMDNDFTNNKDRTVLNGKVKYARVLIKRKK